MIVGNILFQNEMKHKTKLINTLAHQSQTNTFFDLLKILY